jgi:hypothetical protein
MNSVTCLNNPQVIQLFDILDIPDLPFEPYHIPSHILLLIDLPHPFSPNNKQPPFPMNLKIPILDSLNNLPFDLNQNLLKENFLCSQKFDIIDQFRCRLFCLKHIPFWVFGLAVIFISRLFQCLTVG